MLTPPDHPVGLRPEYIFDTDKVIRVTRHNVPFTRCSFTISEVLSETSDNSCSAKPILSVESVSKPKNSTSREFWPSNSSTDIKILFTLSRGPETAEWHIDSNGKLTAKFAPRTGLARDRADVYFLNAASAVEEEVKLEARGQDFCRLHHCVYLGDALVLQIRLRTRIAATYVPFKTYEWDLNVAKGIDVSLVCLHSLEVSL